MVWFRVGDLRVGDHPGLHAVATDASARCVAAFVFDPEEAALATPAAMRSTHESVACLRANLRAIGADLIVRVGDPAIELPAIVRAYGATSVTVKTELEWARRSALARTLDACAAAGATRVDEWDLPLRERPESTAGAVSDAIATARAVKGAPLTPWASQAEYAASLGAIAKALDPPLALAGGAAKPTNFVVEGDEETYEETLDAMPDVETVRSLAGLPDSDFDLRRDAAVAKLAEALADPAFARSRKGGGARTDDAFVMLSESRMLARAAEEADRALPSVPFRVPGGEDAAVRCFEGFLDFYTATSDRERQRMYDRIIEAGKPSAFFILFRDALKDGSLSPRIVYATTVAWEARSKRATDLCANARNVAVARDYQAAVAKCAIDAGAEGPGIPLVGAWNVCSGNL